MAFGTTVTDRRALVPGTLIERHATGAVRGIYHPDTGVLNVLAPHTPQWERAEEVGRIYASLDEAPAWVREAAEQERPASRQDLLALIKGVAAPRSEAAPEGEAPCTQGSAQTERAGPGRPVSANKKIPRKPMPPGDLTASVCYGACLTRSTSRRSRRWA